MTEFHAGLFHVSQFGGGRELTTAFSDGSLKQPVRERRCYQIINAPRSGRFAENRYPLGIATKRRDVLLHPFERRDLVQQAVVARRITVGFLGELRVREETKYTQAIVDGHHHHALLGQCLAVVKRTRASDQSSAVNPHHY